MRFSALFSRRVYAAFFLGTAVVALSLARHDARAGDEVPLYELDPHDRITLSETHDTAVLKVRLLDLPGRRVPTPMPREGFLVVRLLDRPEKEFHLLWHSIKSVELWEEMILAKANELVQQRRLDAAYDYFAYLEQNHPRTAGLPRAMEDYLYAEAIASHTEGKYDGALAMLRELHRRNPRRPGLDKAWGVTTDKLVEQYVAEEDYSSARTLIDNLAAAFAGHATAAKWRGLWKQQAAALLSEARTALAADDLRQADMLLRRVGRLWPETPGARELAQTVHQRYPRVVVGVATPAYRLQGGCFDDWAARRSGRLLYRTLVEFAGPGTEGAEYRCPLGQLVFEPVDRRLEIELTAGSRWSSGEATLTGYEVSRQLLAMADPAQEAYRAAWAELLGVVAVRRVYEVDVELRRHHVRPEALLQTPLFPYAESSNGSGLPPPNGPYVLHSRSAGETVYLRNPHYFAATATQPHEIVERHYPQGAQAIRALHRGQIRLLDRVSPWGLELLREDENIVIGRYGVPLVHCLIPNVRKPLLASRSLRRALVYGIQRQAILEQLLGGAEVAGCRVLSGPFPSGTSPDDPISYGCDANIKPRVYDPRLALTLAEAALGEVTVLLEKRGQKLSEMPQLVLAHPGDEIARSACASIRRQLELVGIPVSLRQLGPTGGQGEAGAVEDEWLGPADGPLPDSIDLLYAELALWEPVVDARRLLGHDGPSGGCSPYLSPALRDLDRARDWPEVRQHLLHIHRIAHDDVAVVPLWQLIDFFAYHRDVQGIGSRPITLYENVERWQAAFRYPAEP